MQVYSRDSSCMTPYGAFITAMSQWWRRGENYAAIRAYEKLGIPIYDMVTAGTFEGGDFNVIEEGCVLIGCGEARTNEAGAKQVASWFEAEGWEVRIAYIDEYYILMVVPIAEKLTAVCLACTDPDIVDWLKAKNHEIIDVPFQDTMALGCNMMSLGNDKVIAPTSSTTLIDQLRARGFEVAAVDTAEISKTGGGIHCMAQALRRERCSNSKYTSNEPLTNPLFGSSNRPPGTICPVAIAGCTDATLAGNTAFLKDNLTFVSQAISAGMPS
ncbi:hypothetical protein GQR58_005251 [Nymphon striatum]|nr:hypothetical protein GQR58_005251 [Nymphon striatum]